MTTIEDRHAAAGHPPVDIRAQEPQGDPAAEQIDSPISMRGGGISPHRSRWMVPEATERAPGALEVPDCGPTMAETIATTTETRWSLTAEQMDACSVVVGARVEAAHERQPMTRERCLTKALHCVMHDRAATHGQPEDVFPMIAAMWSAYLGVPVAAHDVPAMMVLFSVAKFAHDPQDEDVPVDMAGYAACAAELAP